MLGDEETMAFMVICGMGTKGRGSEEMKNTHSCAGHQGGWESRWEADVGSSVVRRQE